MKTGNLCLRFFVGGKGEREIKMDYDYGDREKCLIRGLSCQRERNRYSSPPPRPVLFKWAGGMVGFILYVNIYLAYSFKFFKNHLS